MRCSLLASAIRPCNRLHVRLRLLCLSSQDFASITYRRHYETVSVPVGSNGAVSLDIFSPTDGSRRDGLLVYFPRGPLPFIRPVPEEPSCLQTLADTAGALTVRLNYRLSGDGSERYPMPIHDVGAAWSWLESNMEEMQPAEDDVMGQRKVGVAGQFIGGSLAAMLALTGCHIAPATAAVTTAYLGNPIVDWTMMPAISNIGSHDTDDNVEKTAKAKTSGSRQKTKPVSSWVTHASNPTLPSTKLLGLRRTLFTNQQYPFDPFASPLLFFRTPGSPEPTAVSEDDEFFATLQGTVIEEDHTAETLLDSYVDRWQGLEGPDRSGNVSMGQYVESFLADASRRQHYQQRQQQQQQQEGDEVGSGDGAMVTALGEMKKPTPAFRRSYRRWPPSRSGLGLPRLHMTLGICSPLRDMGCEMIKALERSDRLYGRGVVDRKGEEGDEGGTPVTRDSLASLEDRDGLGVWDKDELRRMGAWFRQQWDDI